MSCPFIIGEHPLHCSAGQTTYVPQKDEARVVCSNETAEDYRRCRRYRHVVWSGLAPTFLAQHKCEEEK